MVITLTGENNFALRQRLDELTTDFIEKHGEMGLEKIDAEQSSAQDIIDAVQSLPFLTQRKMVVVRDLSANKQAVEQIEQIISSISESTDLIIYDAKIDRRTSYFKVLKSQTQLEEHSQLDNRQLAGWVVSRAKQIGAEVSPADAAFLVEWVGGNQLMLASELEKLALYEPKITKQNIELLTEQNPQSKIFDLLDAAFSGNKKSALQLYEEQRAQKVEPRAILAMIAWQLNLLTAAKLGAKRSVDEVARDMGVKSYPMGKAAGMAENLTVADLKNLIDDAYYIDKRSKTVAIDLDEALKTYITTI